MLIKSVNANDDGDVFVNYVLNGVLYQSKEDKDKNITFLCEICDKYKPRQELTEYVSGYMVVLNCPECLDNYDLPADPDDKTY